jgi:hypothetical protein
MADELEIILASADELQPSAGFAECVMATVRRQAAEPPLRFPWARFCLGLAACGLLSAAGASLLSRAAPAALMIAAAGTGHVSELGYASLGLLLSLAASRLPRAFIRD